MRAYRLESRLRKLEGEAAEVIDSPPGAWMIRTFNDLVRWINYGGDSEWDLSECPEWLLRDLHEALMGRKEELARRSLEGD
ncbi:MAG: hypothetical protein QM433_08140 [Euryarchaeota archaeon]|nr:hypothetical protein [Euryarchaeota archaeon]